MIQIKMRQLFFTIIILFIVNGSVSSQQLEAPKRLEKGTLDNGLTYYIYPNPKPRGEAVYRLFIKSGSVFETEEQRGLAHFLEHMAFNGTKHFPENSLTTFLESKGAKFGADLNAHTSMNETVYKLQLPSSDQDFVDSTIMILADWAGGLLLDSAAVEDERGVIFSEWLLKDGPKYDAQNALLLELLNNSRYSKRLTIGDTAVINNAPVSDLRNYYETWYDPSLMAVAVVGDVKPKKVKKAIKKYFSVQKSVLQGKVPEYNIENYEKPEVKTITHESLAKVELYTIQLLENIEPVSREQDYPAYLQNLLLNQLTSARFSELSFSDPAYVKAGYSYFSFLNQKRVLSGSVELAPGKVKQGIIEFATYAEQLFRYGFTQSEIEKAKTDYISNLRRRVESKEPVSSKPLMSEIYNEFYKGYKVISLKDEYKLAEKYIESIDSVALVNQLQTLRKPEQTHYMLYAFDEAKEELPTETELLEVFDSVAHSPVLPYSQDLSVPDELMPQKPSPGSVVCINHIDEIDADQLQLSNGASVTFKSTSLSPGRVIMSAYRNGGQYALDSADYVSATYADQILTLSGVGQFSRKELNYYRAGKMAGATFHIEPKRSGIVGRSSLEDMELMFQQLYMRWMEPRIDTAVFQQVKSKAIEAYQTTNVTPATKFGRDLGKLINGHNYTTRVFTDSLLEEGLTLDRLIPIYTSQFGSANGFNFIILGDCSLKEIQPYIEQYIASLPGYELDNAYKYTYPPTFNDTTFVRNVSENSKSTVRLIFQTNKSIENFNHTELLNDISAEIINKRLLTVLREEMGMIYSSRVRWSQALYPSSLQRCTITFSCKPEDVDTLIQTTLEQLNDLATQPESFKTELSDVLKNLKKEWELDKQNISFWSASIRNNLYNKVENWDRIAHFDKILEQVNTQKVSENINDGLLEVPLIKAVLNPAQDKQKEEH